MDYELAFNNPYYLWYLLSIPFLIYTHFYLLKHTRQKAMKLANFEAIRRVTGEKIITRNITVLILRIILIASIIFAVAGTTFWYKGFVSQNDYVIAIDTSASMTAQDITPSRLEAAKSYASDFVSGIDDKANMAILSFAGTTFIETGMIDNKETLAKTIESVDVSNTGGTDLAGAIITGTNLLSSSSNGKIILIITDGSNTVSAFMTDSIRNSIDYAMKNHVVVHTIGIGTDTGPIGYLPEYYNISAVYNENNLYQVANATGGIYTHIISNADIKGSSEQIKNESKEAMIPVPLSHSLMLFSLAMLFLEWGFISTRFKKLP